MRNIDQLQIDIEALLENPLLECVIWPHYRDRRGFGRLWDGKGATYSHRVAYEVAHGEVPEGYKVFQTCRERGCYNPAHLELRTCKEVSSVIQHPMVPLKTHCLRNHPYDEENTVTTKSGRSCRQCRLSANKRWKAREVEKRSEERMKEGE